MPAQFRHLALALASSPRLRVFFISRRKGVQIPGIANAIYDLPDPPAQSPERLARPVESAVRFGRSAAEAAMRLKEAGVRPRLVIVHPGWGEGLFLRDVWPQARILSYAEYYYQAEGGDIGFDPLFPVTPGGLFNARMMNAQLLLSHEAADALLAPTRWQADRHPASLQGKMNVIFEGVDTHLLVADGSARFTLPDGATLGAADEVITYIARNLEPHRGFHAFMRALPRLLALRPNARVVIVGGEEVSYSPLPPRPHASWRAMMAREVDLGENGRRVHFVGKLPYADYLSLLRVSRAHVYLTYPFVLSWSCVEAMALGCAIVASDTGPVREVLTNGETALLVPFFDGEALAQAICRLLDDRALAARLGAAARATAVSRYDLRDCLAQQVELVMRLLA